MEKGWFLTRINDFELPDKIYGDVQVMADRYLNTFRKGNSSLGVLLTGLKGTGKSLLAKMLCIQAEVPVLVISSAHQGGDFNAMIASITQPCIILFDEFEKVYRNADDRYSRVGEGLLSLFDGVYNTKKMFILTCNDRDKIANAFFNRPTRIRYIQDYDGLDFKTMTEIVQDKLVHKNFQEELLQLLKGLGNMNIDLLLSMIGEMNMYKESIKDSLKYLNLVPEPKKYVISIKGGGYRSGSYEQTTRQLNPRDFFMTDDGDTESFEFQLGCYTEGKSGSREYDHHIFRGEWKDLVFTETPEGGLVAKHSKDKWELSLGEAQTSKNIGSHYEGNAYGYSM
jgi:hypothetical protein